MFFDDSKLESQLVWYGGTFVLLTRRFGGKKKRITEIVSVHPR